ncbi:thioredoxin-like protein [Tricladium varicosporioides]|nr:thioredoxin-like protein [Hymenoscyphus varicosporioides]
MALAPELTAVFDKFHQIAPESVTGPIDKSITDFKATFDPSKAIQVGDTLPAFSLSNALGEAVTSNSLLSKGPLLITFYRGEWCPYCNVALHAMQKQLDTFSAKGVTLVAISPQLPDQSLSTAEKNSLKFPVLSDVGNNFAKKLGILFKMPGELDPILKQFGTDVARSNGDDSLVVPVPATLLVDGKGVVRNTYINPDYTKRVEPSLTLEWVDALVSSG